MQKKVGGVQLITEMGEQEVTEGKALPERFFSGRERYNHRPAPTSVHALQAVVHGSLLEGAQLGEESPVALRWYDARVRAAAVLMSIWCESLHFHSMFLLELHSCERLSSAA